MTWLGADDALKDQETALVKLGHLYRDEKYVPIHDLERRAMALFMYHYRNAASLAEVVRSSRNFMSNTAKAKTAKLSQFAHL